MAVVIPTQRRRCASWDWCTVPAAGHRVHVGEVHVVKTLQGTELRISLNADAEHPPVVHLEAAFVPGGTPMEVTELDATEALELAGVFLRLARIAQEAKNPIG